MNTVSTPIKKTPIEIQMLPDVPSELTPIKENSSQMKKKYIQTDKRDCNHCITMESEGNCTESQLKPSNKRKMTDDLQGMQKKKIYENQLADYSNSFLSEDINADEYMDNLFCKMVNNLQENSSRNKHEDFKGGLYYNKTLMDEEVVCHTNQSLSSDKVFINEREGTEKVPSSNTGKLNLKFLKIKQLDNSVMKKRDDILTESDGMNWTAESLIPEDCDLTLSNQIKMKLLENIDNTEIIKSQTSGWTQFYSSNELHDNNKIKQSCECGPFYGLPSKVQKLYQEQKGINELYPWQQECLNLKAVKDHKNLVYALPTSGGKTLVAEILILREIMCYKKNVLFILPFVSIVQEKIRDFSLFALELGFLVEEYAAGKGIIPPRKRRRKNSILFATIEKATVVVHSLIETSRLGELGLIIVDELHLLSEEGRGAVLEAILTQILYVGKEIQVIGMTATIGNLKEIATFLKAESYSGDFRPVKLSEFVKCDNKILEVDYTSDEPMKKSRVLESSSPGLDPDGIGDLVKEIIPEDSVLIFCPTKKNCENVAILLSNILPRDLLGHKEMEKKSLYRVLTSESNDHICPILKKTIPFGIAYHHSGLTAGERKLLEESFREGTLSVICCTSTLAAGVNLPARRVILRSPYVGKEFITPSKYKQMIGRAGRTGFGSKGESYLICQSLEAEKVGELLRSKMDETVSKMDLENCKNLVLSSIGLGIATSRKSIRELLGYSLFQVQALKLSKDINKMVDSCISALYKHGALKIKGTKEVKLEDNLSSTKLDISTVREKKSIRISNDTHLMISRLGRAAIKGGLSLEQAHELYGDLLKAQSSLVLLTGLHLLYLVTPYDVTLQIKPNYSVYFNVYMQLDSKEIHTAKIIGITEFVISKLATGIKPKTLDETILSRFYVSLILNELWKQQTVWDVAVLFQLPRGSVQSLMSSASTFANSVLRFCEELEELWSFKSLLSEFSPRLAHCCSTELLPLMDLPAVKRGRAKQLYEAGFKNLQIIAVAKPDEIVRTVEYLSNKVASQIIAAAKLLLMEKAENLKEEAEDVLEGISDKCVPKNI